MIQGNKVTTNIMTHFSISFETETPTHYMVEMRQFLLNEGYSQSEVDY